MTPDEVVDWKEWLEENGCENVLDFGEWISFNCIFHEQTDKSRPSCGIYKETGLANCFGCGKHYWEDLCEVFGISAENFTEGIKENVWKSFKNKMFKKKISEIYKRYKLPKQLSDPYGDKDSLGYFRKRGIYKSVLIDYGVRLCRDSNSKYFDYLIFPIYDEKGILFFDARYIRSDGKNPRWKRPKDCAVWKTYFNWENVKNSKVIILVEGATDAIKLIQFGYPAIAAKTFSPYQIDMIMNSNLKYIITMYDNDEAGRTAKNSKGFPIHFTAKANYIFSNCGIRIIDGKLPDYAKDPADVKYDSDIIKCNPIFNKIFA